jgi:hypothetical protein
MFQKNKTEFRQLGTKQREIISGTCRVKRATGNPFGILSKELMYLNTLNKRGKL